MSRPWRIYHNIVFGGFGGLAAYLLVGSLPDLVVNDLFWELLIGVVAGACIGGALGAVDGALGRRWLVIVLGIIQGAAFGAVGGIIGLAIGEGLFLLTQGGFLGRAIGWGVLGAIVGTSEGIANRAPRKISYGVIGGALGGLVGGALFEELTELALNASGNTQLAQDLAAGVGLVLVGACIGALIALVEIVAVGAYFKIVRGKQEGKDFNLVKPTMTIGRDDGNDIPLYDAEIEKRGAAIVHSRGATVRIESKNGRAVLLTRRKDKQPTPILTSETLEDGDRVQLGKTVLLLRKRGKPARTADTLQKQNPR
ncbi:MAG TPA: FHA domain-containing protein [Anaerolineae bacterium]|nr:FHA domain-containing protein [Anaerolineae bacterium]